MLFRENPYVVPTEVQFALIGRVVADWTIIEHLINQLIGRLIGAFDFPMRAVSERLTGPGRENALSLLVEIYAKRYRLEVLDETDVASLRRIDKRFRSLKRVRNDVAHLVWLRSDDQALFATGLTAELPSMRETRWRQGAKIANSELQRWIERVESFAEEIESLLTKLPEQNEATILQSRNTKT